MRNQDKPSVPFKGGEEAKRKFRVVTCAGLAFAAFLMIGALCAIFLMEHPVPLAGFLISVSWLFMTIMLLAWTGKPYGQLRGRTYWENWDRSQTPADHQTLSDRYFAREKMRKVTEVESTGIHPLQPIIALASGLALVALQVGLYLVGISDLIGLLFGTWPTIIPLFLARDGFKHQRERSAQPSDPTAP